MKKNKVFIIILVCTALSCANRAVNNTQKDTTWNKIASYFIVPEKYKNKTGNYSQALKFYNGDTVATAKEWPKRRDEIYRKWMDLLGHWPPVITNQQLKITESKERDNFVQHRVTLKWLPNEETYGYLLVPKTKGKKPAVITVFYEPETAIGEGGKPYRDFAYQLARRGFVALSLGTKASSENKTYALFYPSINNSQSQPLSLLAYAAANAYEALIKEKDVDATRVGIVGHSFGGKWAMFASCLYDKFACAAWSDPGIVFDESRASVNYWEPYYLGYHPLPWRKRSIITANNPAKGLYVQLRKEGYDLHELHALMAPRPFLVSGGSEDPPRRWLALNSTIAVNKLLGYENRVAMTNRPMHAPDQQSNEIIYSFFDFFLKK